MIQTITEIKKYVYKGFEFNTLPQAQKFQKDYDTADRIVKILKPRPKDTGCNFSNGDGYLQHSEESYSKFKVAFQKLLMKKFGRDKDDKGHIKEAIEKCAWWWIGRFYAEGDPIFHPILSRAMCIDEHGREFGQPYYANNPHDAKLFEIKK